MAILLPQDHQAVLRPHAIYPSGDRRGRVATASPAVGVRVSVGMGGVAGTVQDRGRARREACLPLQPWPRASGPAMRPTAPGAHGLRGRRACTRGTKSRISYFIGTFVLANPLPHVRTATIFSL